MPPKKQVNLKVNLDGNGSNYNEMPLGTIYLTYDSTGGVTYGVGREMFPEVKKLLKDKNMKDFASEVFNEVITESDPLDDVLEQGQGEYKEEIDDIVNKLSGKKSGGGGRKRTRSNSSEPPQPRSRSNSGGGRRYGPTAIFGKPGQFGLGWESPVTNGVVYKVVKGKGGKLAWRKMKPTQKKRARRVETVGDPLFDDLENVSGIGQGGEDEDEDMWDDEVIARRVAIKERQKAERPKRKKKKTTAKKTTAKRAQGSKPRSKSPARRQPPRGRAKTRTEAYNLPTPSPSRSRSRSHSRSQSRSVSRGLSLTPSRSPSRSRSRSRSRSQGRLAPTAAQINAKARKIYEDETGSKWGGVSPADRTDYINRARAELGGN